MLLPTQTQLSLDSHPSCIHKGYKYILYSIQIRHALKIFMHCIHLHSRLDSSLDNSKNYHYCITWMGENSGVKVSLWFREFEEIALLQRLQHWQLNLAL